MPETHIDANDHVWRELIDSQGHNERYTDVECDICGVSGQLDNKTRIVYYPAT
jgi:hypothetical protein